MKNSQGVGLRPMPVAVFDTEYSVVTYDPPRGYTLTEAEFGTEAQCVLGSFLNDQLTIFPGISRTLILSGDVLDGFGIPHENPNPYTPQDAPTEHPVLTSIREAGWSVKALTPYMRCRRKLPTGSVVMTVVISDWLTRENTPMLMKGSPFMTCMRMVDWAERTGVQWYTRGSFTGGDLFWKVFKDRKASIEKANEKRRPGNKFPTPWFEKDIRPVLEDGMVNCESPYSAGAWINPNLPEWDEPADFEFLGVDANKAYLAAAGNVKVAAGKLLPGPTDFDKSLSGLWRVRIAPWTDATLPNPAGYGQPLPDGTRWVASQTLELLTEIGHEFTVYESKVNKGSTLLKPWVEKLRDVLYDEDGQIRETLEGAVKQCAVQTIGDWSHMPDDPEANVRICRPDWTAAIIAMFRTILWRKLKAARKLGVIPAWVETDKILCLPSDWEFLKTAVLPSGRIAFPQGVGFGHFKLELEKRPWPCVSEEYDDEDELDEYGRVITERMDYDEDDDFDRW